MSPPFRLRDYRTEDRLALNQLALQAFEQYQPHYRPWEAFRAKIAQWTDLAASAQLIVAEQRGRAVGAVAYVPPGAAPGGHFPLTWASLRMLVVEPPSRGLGVGKALSHECIERARRDGASVIGLHTSPIMERALAMYLGMGFVKDRDLDPIYGVPYGVYRLEL